ncbi:hypothetical protein RvVAR0630_pl07330 (plasmid) [Agrobacterium vitis]|nr:hypothetical protein RvVAR0630_pl07330 [Agrobacterium vitis]
MRKAIKAYQGPATHSEQAVDSLGNDTLPLIDELSHNKSSQGLSDLKYGTTFIHDVIKTGLEPGGS